MSASEIIGSPNTARRFFSIDVIKGLAIIGVLVQHALPHSRDWGGLFTTHMAVPIFIAIMGMNAAMSDKRKRLSYSSAYLRSRLVRLVLPLAIVWAVSLLIGYALDRLTFGPSTLFGLLPLTGPGNYFVPMSLGFALLLPLVVRAFDRNWRVSVLAAVGIDVVYELVAPFLLHHNVFNYFIYDGSPLRMLVSLLAGVVFVKSGLKVTRLLCSAALIGACYLLWFQLNPNGLSFLVPGYPQFTNLVVAEYATLLVATGMIVFRPFESNRILRVIAQLGKLSYQIFLVQIVWFGIWRSTGVLQFFAALIGTPLLAYALVRLSGLAEKAMKPSTV